MTLQDNITIPEIISILGEIIFFEEFSLIGIEENSCGDSPTILVIIKNISGAVPVYSNKRIGVYNQLCKPLHLHEIPLLDNVKVDANRIKKMFNL